MSMTCRGDTGSSGYLKVPKEHEPMCPLSASLLAARMTEISHELVKPQVLNEADKNFEAIDECVIVERVIESDEIC